MKIMQVKKGDKVLIVIAAILAIVLISILIRNEQIITFNFDLENKTKINGEVKIDGISFGQTKNGKILIRKEVLNDSLIEFIPNYEDQYYTISFLLESVSKISGNLIFIIPMDKLGDGRTLIRFYDDNTNCTLDGKIFVDDIYIGETENGNFLLFYQETINHTTFSIKGYTNECFGKDNGLMFYRFWNINDSDIFEYDFSNFVLSNYSARQPSEPEEMQSFIRPEETNMYLKEIELKFVGDIESDLDIIAQNSRIKYEDDIVLFNISEYWQTPKETLVRRAGDCEDWGTTILSSMRNYNNNVSCYNMVWESHISVFCYFDNNFIIYDQGKTKFKTKLELNDSSKPEIIESNKEKIRKMRDDYFEYYGLEKDQQKLINIFNENELIDINENEDFVTWAISLIEN